jgi:methyl-accepting chemotaxis protein
MTTSAVKNRRRQDVNRTRGQFDDILEELTHRIDVPARVRDKVHEAKEAVQVMTEEVEQQVPEIVETHPVTAELLVTADETASQMTELTDEVREEVPSQVAAHVAPLPVTARKRPLPIAAIVVAVLLVLLFLRRMLRRNS